MRDLGKVVGWDPSDGGECLEVSDDLLAGADWRRSSYSNPDGGQCVEIADHLPLVPVRDSKDPARGTLVFATAVWAAFVEGVKKG
ncbi:DUF397 domain-containing protein [Streptomyces sp. NPDC006012]|uniref:DUF397 domain-containing protein n=1 Tax=Streptomyces sp. NPDC006012 TaxID=3364739 RepID=UPI00369A5F54